MITLKPGQLNHLQFQVEDEGKNYWALLLVTLSVCMVSGNVLVIMSVVRERALQNMTNYFIVSLASADLLVAGLVMPFTIYALVSVTLDILQPICWYVKFLSRRKVFMILH